VFCIQESFSQELLSPEAEKWSTEVEREERHRVSKPNIFSKVLYRLVETFESKSTLGKASEAVERLVLRIHKLSDIVGNFSRPDGVDEGFVRVYNFE